MAPENTVAISSQTLIGASDVVEGRLDTNTQTSEVLIIDDAGTDYGSDFDSEGEKELGRILAELDGASVVTEPIDEHDASLQKPRVHIPNVSSQNSSGRTNGDPRQNRREAVESEVIFRSQAAIDIGTPELSSRMCFPQGYV